MQETNIDFCFFVSGIDGDIEKGNPVWDEPLPSGLSAEALKKSGYPVYGDYFEAVSRFAVSENFSALGPFSENIAKIDIHLEKHGALYHPGRIHVSYKNGDYRNFVVNLAVDDFPRKTLMNEFAVISDFKHRGKGRCLPDVYRAGEVIAPSGVALAMFTGEWLDGYHEFHLSGSTDRIVVWDPEGHFFLDAIQASELYRSAAEIMTSFYDPETFMQVYPWHHAAGDFVVRVDNLGKTDVRLITVRQYASLFDFEEKNTENSVAGLLYFLVNLSIRMRLDRLDGIGEYVWADDFVLESTVKGFMDAVSSMRIYGTLCIDVLKSGFTGFSEQDFFEIADEFVSAYNPASPEIPVIRKHLDHHAARLHGLVSQHLKRIA